MTSDAIQQLSHLLSVANAVPRIRPERITRSTYYDPLYRVVLLVLTLKICGKRTELGYSLNHQKLRLYQFVAIHGSLLGPLQEWVAARRAGNLVPLESWTRFPGGYAADSTFDDVLAYVECNQLALRSGTHVVYAQPDPVEGFAQIVDLVEQEELFSAERTVLEELATTTIPLNLLKR